MIRHLPIPGLRATVLVLAAASLTFGCKRSSEKKSDSASLYAVIETTRGTIGLKLLPDEAPNTVQNFVDLATGKKEFKDPLSGGKMVKANFYDGLLFHRVIPGFMIQVGDPVSRNAPFGSTNAAGFNYGWTGPGYEFADELPPAGTQLYDKPCVLGMANHGPNTNGSQFFITEGAGAQVPQLEPRTCFDSKTNKDIVCGYTRFGTGVCGCDLVSTIAKAGPSNTRIVKITFTNTAPSCK
jgi:peptidylprolyl isomerase/peptidyl-prolyl cis-trans isomerase A (cyclophilin A)